jgi:hypothetical protein
VLAVLALYRAKQDGFNKADLSILLAVGSKLGSADRECIDDFRPKLRYGQRSLRKGMQVNEADFRFRPSGMTKVLFATLYCPFFSFSPP